MQIKFTSDSAKAKKNFNKHGVSFETAEEVFYDPYVIFQENDDTGDEQRYSAIGRTKDQQLFVVIFIDCSTDEQQHCHIISAWEAEDYEQRAYAGQF